jgi:hypothetical protein
LDDVNKFMSQEVFARRSEWREFAGPEDYILSHGVGQSIHRPGRGRRLLICVDAYLAEVVA